MARRRIQSKPFSGDLQSLSNTDALNNLSALANLAEEDFEDNELRGTSQDFPEPEMIDLPRVPNNPELYEDQFGVDDVPGIPPGIELLGDLAESESKEDALDEIAPTKPPAGLPSNQLGQLQDPLEFIRMRIQEEPELAQYLPEETRQLLESTQADPERRFVSSKDQMIQEQEPEQPQEEGMLSKSMSAIGDAFGLPGQIKEKATSSISDYFSPETGEEEVDTTETVSEQVTEPQVPPALAALPEEGIGREVSAEDIPTEGLGALPGSVESAKSNPEIVRNIENLLNLKKGDIPEEAWDHIQLTEKVLTQQEQNLSEREKMYKDKIAQGNLNAFDKFAIGVAIALPVIIGMIYGKGAAIATLGGTGRGLEDLSKRQQELDLKNLGKLGEIQKERLGISEKRANLKKEYLKNIENPSVKKLFKSYDVINMSEGPNGEPQITIGKDAMIFGDTIGLSGGDESGVLWYDTNQIRDDDDVKNFKSAVKDGKVALGKMKDANQTIDDVIDIMGIIKEQQPSLYNTFLQQFQPAMYTDESSWKSMIPGTAKSMTIEVVGNDGQVKKVQALPILRQKITALQDVYNKEYLGGNRLTSNMLKHWNDVFPDASAVTSWLKSDFNTMSQQAQNFKNVLNQRAVENLSAEGFLREPLEKILPTSGSDILRSSTIDMQDIEANPEKYRAKVKSK